jgi:hypothetical protein
MLVHFTTLVPVEAGREEALRKTLGRLRTGEQSPFQPLAGTHMARLYVLDHYGGSLQGPVSHRGLTPALLVFSAVVDGPVADWLARLHARFGSIAEDIWSHCAGFPRRGDARAFARWMVAHEIAPSLAVIANPHGTVGKVRRGVVARARLGHFAARMQGAGAAVVRDAFHQEFGR